jgi:hypothetical protein
MNCSRMPTAIRAAVMASALTAISAAKGNWLRAAPRRDRTRESKTVCTADAVKPTLPPCAALRRKFARLFSPAGVEQSAIGEPNGKADDDRSEDEAGPLPDAAPDAKGEALLVAPIGDFRGRIAVIAPTIHRLLIPTRASAARRRRQRPDDSAPTIFPDQLSPFSPFDHRFVINIAPHFAYEVPHDNPPGTSARR